MLLWVGFFLLVVGAICFGFDRQAAHYFHARVNRTWDRRLHRTTDWAKGGNWLVIAAVALLLSWAGQRIFGKSPVLILCGNTALAFLASLAVASLVLHSVKIVLGRRRPRDELEHGLYGFVPFNFSLRTDSFPSGHAMTIFCVAIILCAVMPMMSPLWLAIALYLGLTRALLNAHYLSDVFVGAGVGILITREVLILLFPALAQGWF